MSDIQGDEEIAPGEENDSPEQKADKETKKYLKVLEAVKAVVGGEKNLTPARTVDSDTTADIVAELFADEEKELITSVKTGLKELLKNYVEMESEVKKERKKLDDLQLRKRKEFRVGAEKWLQKIDRSAVMKEGYKTALEAAFKEQAEKDKQ